MLYRCRHCNYIVTAEEDPEECPACKAVFYDVFFPGAIVTYRTMQEINDVSDPSDIPDDRSHLPDSLAEILKQRHSALDQI